MYYMHLEWSSQSLLNVNHNCQPPFEFFLFRSFLFYLHGQTACTDDWVYLSFVDRTSNLWYWASFALSFARIIDARTSKPNMHFDEQTFNDRPHVVSGSATPVNSSFSCTSNCMYLCKHQMYDLVCASRTQHTAVATTTTCVRNTGSICSGIIKKKMWKSYFHSIILMNKQSIRKNT